MITKADADSRRWSRLWLAVVFVSLTQTASAWTPGTSNPAAAEGFFVDPLDRRDVLAFYQTVYKASENYAANMAWNGNVAAGIPGATSAAFKEDTRRRINFYRALSSLPADITFDATKSSKSQEAALMMTANNALSHTPPSNWTHYTPNGAEAAGAANIALGAYGPAAVDGYMRDDGSNNVVVGHRRWLHFSRAQVMGTGDIPVNGAYNSANAIWVIGQFKPAPASQFIAWPNRGYVPIDLMPARWSLSYPGANFAAATVTMTQNGVNVPTNVISRTDNGFGDNTIVWTPSGLPSTVSGDTTYQVTIAGINGAGVPTSHNYSVTLFDPNLLGESLVIGGGGTVSTNGGNFAFNSIAQADAYELRVATDSVAAWTEGAEDAPAPQVAAATTGSYPLRQTEVKRTGTKAFQLAFPDFEDQSFRVVRELIPAANSQLHFYDRALFSTTNSTLSAELSTDDGRTWTTLWSRNGVGLHSANWDPAFNSRTVNLAAYAGQIVQVRFMMRANGGSVAIGTASTHGFFLDDVTVTNATQLVSATTTALPGNATSFQLNASTAGATLVAGTTYYLRIRPNVGTHWFDFGSHKMVTAQVGGYSTWVAQYPSLTGGTGGDHDRDGLPNGVEYAFGLNPMAPNSSALPQPVRVGNSLGVTFNQPAGVNDVTYAAEWSPNLLDWNVIIDTGTNGAHTFNVNTSGQPNVFFRHRVTIAP